MKKCLCLAAGLLILLLAACQPGGFGPTAASITELSASTVPSTTLAYQTAIPSQTISPTPLAPTFTALPITPSETTTFTPEPTAAPVVFAAIGDYGSGDQNEGDVAALINSWKPDFIITLGDNNYPNGAADFMDQAVGQFFHSYIYPYKGSFGEGADTNRFFPSLGNHDLHTDNAQPYYDYFTLPGNERYYDFTWGPVHLFALDSIETEPDGVGASSIQAEWLKAGLAESTSTWNIVYMHYPPYSSGTHGSIDWTRWPYKEWGADAVLAGHDHTYERLEEGGLPYFVNGLGGFGRYDFPNILEGSQVRFNHDYGAMRIEATDHSMQFEFITRDGQVVDSFELNK